MWVFLNNAMLSVVQYGNAPTNLLLVRARLPGDLESLNLTVQIEETPDRDYRFRCIVPRLTFQSLMVRRIDAIDYPNFKSSIAPTEQARHDWYMDVWNAGVARQDGGKYSPRRRRGGHVGSMPE